MVDQQEDAPASPPECSPCRGTGKVISGLGGKNTTVDCPWCEGTGVTIPEHNAQERHVGSGN